MTMPAGASSARRDGDERRVVAEHERFAGTASGTTTLHDLIVGRQNVSARRLVEPGPSPAQLEAMLEAAAAAPDHGRLVPYRFILIPSDHRGRLAEAFCQALAERAPGATLEQFEAAREKAYRAPLLLLAVANVGEDGHDGIPVIEKIIATGCAIQNLLLAACAAGFGSGLGSGQSMNSASLRALCSLGEHERAVCFVSIGTVARARPRRSRPTPASIVSTLALPEDKKKAPER